MADLRIVDAPVLLQESITDDVKIPTGGLGNFSVRLGDILWYVITKGQLANKNYVDLSSKGVKDSLDEHIADKANPHQVTKWQVGLGNVDNTADIDKPVSNTVKSAIITATNDMATKTYVNSKDGDLTKLTTTDKTSLVKAINEVVSVKADKATKLVGYGISDAYTKSEIDTNYGGVKTLYDKNVVAGAGVNGWTDVLIETKDGLTQRQVNEIQNVSLNFKYKNPDILGSVDTSALLQAFVNQVNSDKLSRLYIPTVNENYLIDNSVICEYPIAIVGDKAPYQNRYMGKNGNILIGTTNIAFKFGNGRDAYPEVTYIADQYSVSNIGFLPKNTTDEFTKTAIQWYVKTNAPDRGLLLKEVSASRMDKVFHLLSGKETDLASLTVQNSCLSNNNYVIYSEGGLNGLNFVNNQAEQNAQGAIYGCFNGSVNIADNMLEGSRNTITITPAPITGSHLKFNFERNYIEACTGDYLVSLDTTVNGQVTIKDNFHFDLNEYEKDGRLIDVVRLRGAFNYINNVDGFSITLHEFFNVIAEPLLSRDNKYNVRINANNLNTIKNILTYAYDSKKALVLDSQKPNAVMQKIQTNLGNMYYKTVFGGSRINIPTSVSAGDIIKLTIAYYSDIKQEDSKDTAININDVTLTYGITGSINTESSNGVVKVASMVTMVGFNASALSLYVGSIGYACYVLNAQVEKIGVSAKSEDKLETYMTLPQLYKVSEGLSFTKTLDAVSGVEIPPNMARTFNATVYGLTSDNKVNVSLRVPDANIMLSVASVTIDSLVIQAFNLSSSTISLTNNIVDINVT